MAGRCASNACGCACGNGSSWVAPSRAIGARPSSSATRRTSSGCQTRSGERSTGGTRSAGISTTASPSSSSGPRSTSSRSTRRSTAGWTIALSAGCSARWVNGEKARTCSISSPKSSTRSGSRPVDGNTSTMPPRTANWPRSSTRSTRSYPASASCSGEPVDPRLVADPERERARSRGARRQPFGERRDRRADEPPGVEDVERPVALTDEVRRRDEPRLVGDAPARKEGDLRGVPEPRGAVGSVPRVGVLGQQHEERAAELGVERREHERQHRLRDAGARRQRADERLEALGAPKLLHEGGERRDGGRAGGGLVHAAGGDRAPQGHRTARLTNHPQGHPRALLSRYPGTCARSAPASCRMCTS